MSASLPLLTTDAETEMERAESRLAARDVASAVAGFDCAQRLGADPNRCSAGRWQCFMLQGQFAEAWRESDVIRSGGAPDVHRFWDGRSLRGKRVVLRCVHGFGDAVQFLRYVPALRREAAELTIETAPKFAPLARCVEGVTRVVTWEQPFEEWETQIELMELPYCFRSTLRDLPCDVPYLRVPDEIIAGTCVKMPRDKELQIGLAWTAGEWNASRSLTLDLLRPLLAMRGCVFWSLHPEALCGSGIRDGEIAGKGLLPLAALVANLDLVISVDTLAAHLAGAMGKPVWLLLQHCADWRWMMERDDSPWYPTMLIFRQPQQGNWHKVVESVQKELQTWIDART